MHRLNLRMKTSLPLCFNTIGLQDLSQLFATNHVVTKYHVETNVARNLVIMKPITSYTAYVVIIFKVSMMSRRTRLFFQMDK